MEQLSLLDDPPPAPAPKVAAAPPDATLARLAAGLPAGLRLGTSSWGFPGWAGLVYADEYRPAVLSRDGLPAYAAHPLLTTVAVDSGFYAPLDAGRLARYAALVPANFRFLVKAPALITDRHRRTATGQPLGPNPSFLDPALAVEIAVRPFQDGLGTRAGVLLWQFPPLLTRAGADDPTAARRFAEDLYRFLRRLPSGPVYAVELRDAALLTPDLAAALRHGGAVPGLAAHPRLPDLETQGRLFAAPTDGPLVLRWLLRGNRRYGEARDRYSPFDRLAEPDPAARAAVVGQVNAALAAGRAVWVIANNKAEGSAPLTLIELARALGREAGATSG